MTTKTTVVLLIGSSSASGQISAVSGERSKLESILDSAPGDIEVNLISLGIDRSIMGIAAEVDLRGQSLGVVDRILKAFGAFALHRKFAAVPIGRLLNSMGPVDQGRVFWRAVRRNPEALVLIRRSDIAIAADMPAVKTAWLAAKRRMVAEAYYDHRAASVGVTFQLPKS